MWSGSGSRWTAADRAHPITIFLVVREKKHKSCYASFPSFINTLASCRIGSNAVNIEDTPSFTEANPSSFFHQGKHLAFPFNRISPWNTLCYVMIVHLHVGVYWNLNCTQNTLTNPLFVYPNERKIIIVCYAYWCRLSVEGEWSKPLMIGPFLSMEVLCHLSGMIRLLAQLETERVN
jgi:hypothetical protein